VKLPAESGFDKGSLGYLRFIRLEIISFGKVLPVDLGRGAEAFQGGRASRAMIGAVP
jgi:hypothetical protein